MRILKLSYILFYAISINLSVLGHIKASNLEIGEQVTSTLSQTIQSKSFTPLYKEAQSFLEVWNGMNKDNIDETLVKYINDIIVEDQYQNFPALQQISVSVQPQNLEFIEVSKQEDKLRTSLNNINSLYQEWCAKDLLNNNSSNAFASYFLGYFLSPINSELRGSISDQNLFKNFLDDASKKYYVRATNLLLRYLSWRKEGINKSVLQVRNLMTDDPKRAIFEFLSSHTLRGQIKWEDISNLKNTLYYISADQSQYDNYIKLYKSLSNELKNILTLRVKKEASWRIDIPTILNSFGTGVLSLTIGINNIILHTSSAMFGVGITQAIISAPQIVAGVINTPHIYDLVFKAKQSNLLPSSYGNEEISIQSHLIALLGILNNKEANFNSKKMYKYAHYLSHFILENYKDEEKSLISMIDDRTQDQLEYKQ